MWWAVPFAVYTHRRCTQISVCTKVAITVPPLIYCYNATFVKIIVGLGWWVVLSVYLAASPPSRFIVPSAGSLPASQGAFRSDCGFLIAEANHLTLNMHFHWEKIRVGCLRNDL